jgi:hypothetical protein
MQDLRPTSVLRRSWPKGAPATQRKKGHLELPLLRNALRLVLKKCWMLDNSLIVITLHLRNVSLPEVWVPQDTPVSTPWNRLGSGTGSYAPSLSPLLARVLPSSLPLDYLFDSCANPRSLVCGTPYHTERAVEAVAYSLALVDLSPKPSVDLGAPLSGQLIDLSASPRGE